MPAYPVGKLCGRFGGFGKATVGKRLPNRPPIPGGWSRAGGDARWIVRNVPRYHVGVYAMRMARVNITMPDELYREARQAGLNVSQLAQLAVAAELQRQAKIAELDAYLAELQDELGPTSDDERAEARAWAEKALGSPKRRRSA